MCTECWDRTLAFDAGVCAGTLEHPLSRVVTIYKDGGERRLAIILASLLGDVVAPWCGWADAVAYVPATEKARRRRGFDHAREISEELARLVNVPHAALLTRARAQDQRVLGRRERFENASGTFAVTTVELPERVLLIDDVLTTGATLDAAASVLRGAGVAEVRVATIARAW